MSAEKHRGSAVAFTAFTAFTTTTATRAWTRASLLFLILTTAALVVALTTTISASASPASASTSSPSALLSTSSTPTPTPAAAFPRRRACKLTCQSLADCPRSFDGLRCMFFWFYLRYPRATPCVYVCVYVCVCVCVEKCMMNKGLCLYSYIIAHEKHTASLSELSQLTGGAVCMPTCKDCTTGSRITKT
jgi:hypothetical protein